MTSKSKTQQNKDIWSIFELEVLQSWFVGHCFVWQVFKLCLPNSLELRLFFPNYFADFLRVVNLWMSKPIDWILCAQMRLSLFFFFFLIIILTVVFVRSCLLDIDPSVGSIFFQSTLKLHVVLNCLNLQLCHMICFDIKFKLCIECWAAIILFLWGHTNVEVRKLTLKIIEKK